MTLRLLGAVALLCFLVHAGYHVASGRVPDVFWGCHVATLLVGIGALLGRAEPIAVGVLWLCFGNPLWVLDISTGGEFLPTSLLTHVGGFMIGLWAAKRVGFPRFSWVRAALGYVALLGLTRVCTPRAANVNLAFAVAPGWEKTFPSYPLYLAMMMALGTATFFAAELGLRKALT